MTKIAVENGGHLFSVVIGADQYLRIFHEIHTEGKGRDALPIPDAPEQILRLNQFQVANCRSGGKCHFGRSPYCGRQFHILQKIFDKRQNRQIGINTFDIPRSVLKKLARRRGGHRFQTHRLGGSHHDRSDPQ